MEHSLTSAFAQHLPGSAMGGEWTETTWGNIASLHYGKALRGYDQTEGIARVYGTNGPIGWHSEQLWDGPGVIIGRKGAYRGVHYSDCPYWVIDTAYSLQPLSEVKLHPRWVYYQVLHLDPNSIDDGSPIPSTTRPAFYAQPVLLPPYDEQRRIADLLGALDDKIELNRKTAVTLGEQAQALFRSWFVDFDPVHDQQKNSGGKTKGLKGFFPDRFDESGLPEGWKRVPLSSLGDFLNGLALQKYAAQPDDETYPVIKIAELRTGPTAKSARARSDLPSAYIVDDGDHIFSWSGSLMHVRWSHGRGALNQHLFKVTAKNVPQWLLYHAVEYHLPQFQAIASAKAVTMGHIQRHHLDEALVNIPTEAVLNAADAVISPIHERTLSLALHSRTLAGLRDTLLPKLISGELRIQDAETAVEVAA